MSTLELLDERISELFNKRRLAAHAPVDTINRINDEISALQVERVNVVRGANVFLRFL